MTLSHHPMILPIDTHHAPIGWPLAIAPSCRAEGVQIEKKPNHFNHLAITMPVRKSVELEATSVPTVPTCRGSKGGWPKLSVCMAPYRILTKIITTKLFREEMSELILRHAEGVSFDFTPTDHAVLSKHKNK